MVDQNQSEPFFDQPILNSPYEHPSAHWELVNGLPTQKIVHSRRKAEFITPVPKPKKHKGTASPELFDESLGLGDGSQKYDPMSLINELRKAVDAWRALPNERDWQVTPHTARLLRHWRNHQFSGMRPFFCQIEAVEVAIWLTEVAPQRGKTGKQFINHLDTVNREANPGLSRLALKLATGAGKTTVMAMLIAWQTINAVRSPNSRNFTRSFLVVTPGITIRDRLRELQPNDPNSYYRERELVPNDMQADLQRARIVITNYHSFKLRERIKLSKGGKSLLKGKRGEELSTVETEGQMLKRVLPELMGSKNLMVLNDEAHHCYRGKSEQKADIRTAPEGTTQREREDALREEQKADVLTALEGLKGEERKAAKQQAESNQEAARLWISGLEIVAGKLGINRVMDLSATPFFLSGSGYAEGTLFPWTMSDFSLMDAIECGIVKLPRVPVADNIPGEEMPTFRELWKHIGHKMPKKGKGKAGPLDPLSIPAELQTALEALYGHYAKTFKHWQDAGIEEPPCFIVVCNNTSTSKLVYDYIAGFKHIAEDGSECPENGRLALFRNFDAAGEPLPRPNTLLIDSEQLESGEALDKNFREAAADEIERYRREIRTRNDGQHNAEKLTDEDLLREVMNTVGKPGTLGGNIRCVVSVSMLTEGWDARTVTHVLGVRAFGTQLLCEQVIGRALRRQSYDLNEQNRFNVEYADVLGIPFDFTAKPVVTKVHPPRETIQVTAIRPDRDALEIRFPRVSGYRAKLPEDRLTARFTADSVLELTPELTGPAITQNAGIIGEAVDLNLIHTGNLRRATLLYHLAKWLVMTHWRDQGQLPRLHLFGQLKGIAGQWLDDCLRCKGGTWPAQLMYQELAAMACNRITAAITQAEQDQARPIEALLDPFNPTGSTRHVNFNTSKAERWQTDPRKSHVNWVILDSDWEAEFCRIAEAHPQVIAYVKNHSLGLEVPYRYGSASRTYRPDFIVQIDDGNGLDDPLNLVVEIKGYRGEDARAKKLTMDSCWIPGVNRLQTCGRWAFAEFTDPFTMEQDFASNMATGFGQMIEQTMANTGASSTKEIDNALG